MCALLIGGQYALSFAVGIEVVTLLLACFSAVFGVRMGMLCAVAFSLLRCFVFGFHLGAILLYLLYYPAFAAAFGGLGHIKEQTFRRYPLSFALAVNVLLAGICAACAALYALDLVKVSRLYAVTLYVLLWVVFGLCAALCAAFDVLLVANRAGKETSAMLKGITFTAVAVVFTVLFTLLDDVVTPLLAGMSRYNALVYFYGSFAAMLPQTVCTVVTMSVLFLPLTALLRKIKR